GKRGATDRTVFEAHGERRRIEARTRARGANALRAFPPLVPPDFLPALLGVEAAHHESGAVAALAPAVFRVIREEARVERRETASALGARPRRGEHRLVGLALRAPGGLRCAPARACG